MNPILLLPLLLAAPAQEAGAPPAAQDPAPAAPAGTAAPAPEDGDEPALLVDGAPVGRDEYRDWLVRNRGDAFVADFYVLDHLVHREAARLGIAVPTEEARERARAEAQVRIDAVHRGSVERYEDELESTGRTLAGRTAERVRDLERELLLDAVASHGYEPPEERLRAEWERRYGRDGRLLDVRVLRVKPRVRPIPGAGPAEMRAAREAAREEARTRVEELRAQVLAGADLAALARAHSSDESAANGGLVEGFDVVGWSDEQVAAIDALAPGATSEVMEARGSFWILQKVGERETPFESVRDELALALRAEGPSDFEVAAFAGRLLEEAQVEVLPAFHLEPEPGATSRPDDEPVLRIDGEDVTREELGAWLLDVHGEIAARRYAEEQVLLALGREVGIDPTPEEIERRAEEDIALELANVYDGDEAKLLEEVVGSGRTMEQYRRLRRQLAHGGLVVDELWRRARDVTEEDVRALWRERHGEDGRLLELRWIRVDARPPEIDPADPAGTEERRAEALAEAVERARGLADRARAGEDFGELARAESDDPTTAPRGGEPAADFRVASLPPHMQEAVRALEIGGISDPLVFDDKAYVFELRDVVVTPYETVRDALRHELETRRPNEVESAAFRNGLVRDVEVRTLPAMFSR